MEAVGTARVQLKHIEANPWRRLDSYPIDENKVAQLKASVERTGFWDNLVMRPHPDGRRRGIYQTSYGHHRMEALRQLYGEEHEIGIIVRDLSDAKMLQIMAAENDDVYDLNVAVIFETVMAGHDFLLENRDEMLTDVEMFTRFPQAGKLRLTPEERQAAIEKRDAAAEDHRQKLGHGGPRWGEHGGGGQGPPPEWLIGKATHVFRKNYTRETMQIAIFLDWPVARCRDALMMAKHAQVDELKRFRNMRVADEFKRQVSRYTDLKPETLHQIADDIVAEDMGSTGVKRTFQNYAITEGDFAARRVNKVVTMAAVLRKASSKIRAAMLQIDEVSSIRMRFGDGVYGEAMENAEFELALEELIEALQKLRRETGDEETHTHAAIEGEVIEIKRS